jgi:hypothetical protein
MKKPFHNVDRSRGISPDLVAFPQTTQHVHRGNVTIYKCDMRVPRTLPTFVNGYTAPVIAIVKLGKDDTHHLWAGKFAKSSGGDIQFEPFPTDYDAGDGSSITNPDFVIGWMCDELLCDKNVAHEFLLALDEWVEYKHKSLDLDARSVVVMEDGVVISVSNRPSFEMAVECAMEICQEKFPKKLSGPAKAVQYNEIRATLATKLCYTGMEFSCWIVKPT